jgi:Tol biopolymer transport system component
MRKWSEAVFALAALTIPLESREILAQTSPGEGFAVIFYSGRAGNNDIFILRPGEREPVNLTRHQARDQCPAASPDGKRIAVLSDRGGNFDIYTMAVDGSDVRQLPASRGVGYPCVRDSAPR